MKSRLIELETLIDSQRRCFYQIGKALKQIRDERLYRELMFDSFEAYLKNRWEMSRSQAYRLIEAARVIDNLSPIGDILPENEAQLRALVNLNPFDQRKVWRDFLSAGMPLNAANIQRFVAKCPPSQKPRIDLSHIISAAYKQAVLGMLEQIRLAGQEGWTSTSRQAAFFWLAVMKDKIRMKV